VIAESPESLFGDVLKPFSTASAQSGHRRRRQGSAMPSKLETPGWSKTGTWPNVEPFPKGGDESLTVLDAIRGAVAKSLGRHDDFLGQRSEARLNSTPTLRHTAPVRVCKTSRNAITAS
jgi:hypothetical protein